MGYLELAMRRQEVEDAIGKVSENLRAYVIYRCQVGSKAFGLARDESDDDRARSWAIDWAISLLVTAGYS